MSIFKDSFGKTVKQQIKLRESNIGGGDRTFFLQRQCTIRLASGVDMDLGGGNAYSHTSAINNVLQGGILSPTYSENEDGTRGPFKNFTTKKGFESTYDSPIDGYGRVPMPGITNVQIKTKTAYGSLREATVNFECHNLEQLSILERLYMRPGYPCLLEWALSPYLSNTTKGKVNTPIPFISDKKEFFTDPKQFIDEENKRDKDIQEAIQRLIREKKEEYSNNYDGLYGIVKNFNYSIRQDGGFKCTTELIAIGEVLDSLIGVDGTYDTSISFIEEFLEDLNEYSFAVSDIDAPGGQGGVQDGSDEVGDDYDTLVNGASIWRWNTDASVNRVGDFDPGDPIPKEDRSPYENDKSFFDFGQATINVDERTKRRNEIKELLKERGIKVSEDIKVASVNTYKDIKPLVYITWRGLVKMFNYYLNDLNLIRFTTLEKPGVPIELKFNENKFSSNKALFDKSNNDFPIDFSVDVTAEKLKSLDISTNPKVCFLPENFKSIADYRTYVGNDIAEICFEASYLYKTFKSQYYIKEEDNEKINENFTLGKFLQKIWGDVNDCCAGIHNFQLISHFQDPNLIKVIDQEFQPDIKKEDIHEFKVLGTKSIVRDFNYDLTVPSSLTSTIAIAAQNAKSPQTLEEVTIRSFNKGLKNRFYHPVTKTSSKVADKIKNQRRRAFDKVLKLKQYSDYKVSGDTGLYDITYDIVDPTIESIVGNNDKLAFTKYYEYIEAITEIQIFIERLKGEIEEWEGAANAASKVIEATKEGYREAREAGDNVIQAASAADDAGTQAAIDQFFIEEGEIVAETPILAQVNRYMRVLRNSDWGDNSESKLNKYGWKLAGDPYPDWDYIPDSDISKAKNYLKKANNLKRELKAYNLSTWDILDDFDPDITTIIPLKLNMKLDGISGIVIGNVFNLDQSRLPKSYKNSGVSFIVTGEQQEINGQDWITTITGQAVLL